MKIGEYDLNTLIIKGMGTNCYFLSKDNNCILVDSAGDDNTLIDYINNKNLNLLAILITHGHYDHIEALDMLNEKFPNAKIYALDIEKEVIENNDYSLMTEGLKQKTLDSIIYIKDNTIINELGLDIKILSTPGHTKGSSCYYIKDLNIMFSGDTLFHETYGRTDLPTGDDKNMAKSVAIKLMEFNDDLMVLPGHGFRTTIGYERNHNPLCKDYIVNWAKN